MKSKIWLVISREYSMRVKKKGFIITTLLFPLLMAGLMFAPALLQGMAKSKVETITIYDPTGIVAPEMIAQSNDQPYQLAPEGVPVDSLMANLNDYAPLLVMSENVVENPSDILLLSEDFAVDRMIVIEDDAARAIETVRLKSYDIDNLDEIIANISVDPSVRHLKIDESGVIDNSDAALGLIVGIAMAFVLYMFILIYGQLVMQSIIEEKNNRVLELIVTSIKPRQLMLGKLIGMGAVALTQVAVWGLLIAAIVKFALPSILGETVFTELEGMMNGTLDLSTATTSPQLLQSLAILSSLGYIFQIFGYLMVYLVGGFMFYAAIYAAIGASVDNAQDGAQLQSFATFPIIIALVLSMSVAQAPDSPLAVWLSIIPFTSPMVMMMRLQTATPIEMISSIALLYASAAFVVWFAAKIYRIGIFMYGKKPTVRDLIKWARYK